MRTCSACPAVLPVSPKHPNRKYCSPKCYKRWWARQKRGYTAPQPQPCAICAQQFTPPASHPEARTCSRKCSAKLEYQKHSAQYKQRAQLWTQGNPEKHRTSARKSRAKNPDLYRKIWRLKMHRRNAIMRNVPGTGISRQQWDAIVESQNGRCWWCGEEKPLHMDHVIPVTKGGHHSPENIVGACKPCNSRKKDHLWPRDNSPLLAA
jgi:5-methylcytosine-specific restriction endonuclease McrA